jgi:hypothetical protein
MCTTMTSLQTHFGYMASSLMKVSAATHAQRHISLEGKGESKQGAMSTSPGKRG